MSLGALAYQSVRGEQTRPGELHGDVAGGGSRVNVLFV
jgi:hypothetical protein